MIYLAILQKDAAGCSSCQETQEGSQLAPCSDIRVSRTAQISSTKLIIKQPVNGSAHSFVPVTPYFKVALRFIDQADIACLHPVVLLMRHEQTIEISLGMMFPARLL